MLAAVANAALLVLYGVVGLQMLRAFLSHRRRLRQKAKRLVLELAFSSEERSGARVRPDRDRDMAA
ncbi:hypothetical protein MY494_02075 [Synechococcus sp. A10-1-5-1]|uniref:hypothetical protein n=1 Tax=Synechococcus sp. A10-1-5-1 TaxID=2936507 RepID=UPI00200165B0|nr:hypothetical protein [Synechococcus sp. A10-1-5-1]UPM50605.1 hypothetical protein MY494_02075 [Synechococcus sp. A10-1-5-1]